MMNPETEQQTYILVCAKCAHEITEDHNCVLTCACDRLMEKETEVIQ
jgi:hypothetical protein